MVTGVRKKTMPLIILATIVGGFFLFMGGRTLIDRYYCVPTDMGELKIVSGVLVDIEKNRRFGDSIVIENKNQSYHLGVAPRLSKDLDVLRSKIVTVGVVDNLICGNDLMYVEAGGNVFLSFDSVLQNKNRGTWIYIFLSLIYFSIALFVIFNALFKVRRILRSHGK